MAVCPVELFNVPLPPITSHEARPVAGAIPASVAVAAHTLWLGPATAGEG